MQKNLHHLPNSLMPIAEAFKTLHILSDGLLINGLDEWRHPTGADSLHSVDPVLSQLVTKQPPSKFGRTDMPSLWTATHFQVALPALGYALRMYGSEDTTASSWLLNQSELETYFVAFPHIVRHYREFKALQESYGGIDAVWWSVHLEVPLAHVTSDTPLHDILASLPIYLRDKATLVLANQGDSLVGRIVLAYLLTRDISPDIMRLDKRSLHFLKSIGEHPNKSLYERLVDSQQELSALDDYLSDYDEASGLDLGTLLKLVRWYGRPELVEMIIPGLVGAAAPAIRALLELFRYLQTQGAPNYTDMPVELLPSVQKFRATQSLQQIGRLSLVKDILGLERIGNEAAGVTMRRFASCIYSEQDRLIEWGNVQYYVPDDRQKLRSFSVYRQDICNIIYCAALVEEQLKLANNTRVRKLKQLAEAIAGAKNVAVIRTLVRTSGATITALVSSWEKRYPGHERLRILYFISQSFGLDVVRPIPIPLDAVNKSFIGSFYDGKSYHLNYQEANETISLKIILPPEHNSEGRKVRYCTIDSETKNLPITADGIPYAAWLEIEHEPYNNAAKSVIIPVPGRGTIDPFGRVGDLHAGEIVGFGCSVHHAALGIVLAELASLGARRSDLEKIKQAFMRINGGMHERYDMANYQLAMTTAAFDDNAMITIDEYLENQPDSVFDTDRSHLAAYRNSGQKPIDWAEAQAARLALGYPQLYPHNAGSTLDPRCSWYDGTALTSKTGSMSWYMFDRIASVKK
jgi:hypothetical protein